MEVRSFVVKQSFNKRPSMAEPNDNSADLKPLSPDIKELTEYLSSTTPIASEYPPVSEIPESPTLIHCDFCNGSIIGGFCTGCGAWICAECGEINVALTKECGNCGHVIE